MADFAAVMGWFVLQGLCGKDGSIEAGSEESMLAHTVPLKNVIFWLIVGLMLLLARARMLAWGTVYVAQSLGISDLVIGLTVVAVDAPLPELTSALAAVCKMSTI